MKTAQINYVIYTLRNLTVFKVYRGKKIRCFQFRKRKELFYETLLQASDLLYAKGMSSFSSNVIPINEHWDAVDIKNKDLRRLQKVDPEFVEYMDALKVNMKEYM